MELGFFHGGLEASVQVFEIRKLEVRRRAQISPSAVEPIHLFFSHHHHIKLKNGFVFQVFPPAKKYDVPGNIYFSVDTVAYRSVIVSEKRNMITARCFENHEIVR